MSTLEVNKITPVGVGTSVTLGDSGDTFTIPSGVTLNGSSATLTGFATTNGITEADQWRVTSSFTGNADPISSNWERNDNSGFGYLGTGMTQSSGIFTFPSTGIWLIRFQGAGYATSTNSQAIRFYISTTTNNSTYTQAAHSANGLYNFGSGLETMVSCYAETMFDVTSTSTHKVRFSFGAGQGPEGLYGDSTKNFTSVTFVRIGDT